MGNSLPSGELREEEDLGSQSDADRGLNSFSSEGAVDTAGRDISPVVSEQDELEDNESQQSPGEPCKSKVIFLPSSSTAMVQGAVQLQNNEPDSPWNMPQAGRGPGNNVFVTPVDVNREATIRQELNANEEPPLLEDVAWQPSVEVSPDEACLEDAVQATCSFLSSEMTGALLGEDWESDGYIRDENGRVLEGPTAGISLGDYSRPTGLFFPWMPPSMMPDPSSPNHRRISDLSTASDGEGDISVMDFHPPVCQNYEWMGRSIETLMLGHRAAAPVLALPELGGVERTHDETAGRPEARCTRRTSVCSLDANRSQQLACRRTFLSHGARFRRRNTCTSAASENASNAGPNILLSLLAREVSVFLFSEYNLVRMHILKT